MNELHWNKGELPACLEVVFAFAANFRDPAFVAGTTSPESGISRPQRTAATSAKLSSDQGFALQQRRKSPVGLVCWLAAAL